MLAVQRLTARRRRQGTSRRRVVKIWLVVVLMLASSAMRAAIITVGTGAQTATPSDAVRQARDGDTILVRSGEYRGDVAVLHQ
jgi:hypothetical protein